MRKAGVWSILRFGIISVAIALVVASFSGSKSRANPNAVSLKLIQTFNKSELVSMTPISARGVIAVRTRDAVHLWDTRAQTFNATLPKHNKMLDAFFSIDGSTFITSSKEKPGGNITRLWDAQTGQLKTTLSGFIVFGPRSGSNLVITLADKELKFWNADTGELQKTVLSPDGRLLLTVGNKSIKVWNTADGNLVTTLEGAHHPVAFSPDGKALAATGANKTVLVWTRSD